MGATQPISIGSARLKPIERSDCTEELQIIKQWIEKDEKEEK